MQRLIMVGSSPYQQESLKKTILAVVHDTRKPLHYFQEHTVVVITQLLLSSTIRGTDYAGRIAKWGAVLGASDIKYMPHAFVKGPSSPGSSSLAQSIPIGERSREPRSYMVLRLKPMGRLVTSRRT